MYSLTWSALAAALIAASTVFAPRATAHTVVRTRDATQVRNDFVLSGYQVDPPTTWWTNRATTFTARDVSRDRVVMVLVFPSLEAALAERLTAAASEGEGDLSKRASGARARLWAERMARQCRGRSVDAVRVEPPVRRTV
jgi:hypothetical protein